MKEDRIKSGFLVPTSQVSPIASSHPSKGQPDPAQNLTRVGFPRPPDEILVRCKTRIRVAKEEDRQFRTGEKVAVLDLTIIDPHPVKRPQLIKIVTGCLQAILELGRKRRLDQRRGGAGVEDPRF
jgi:hypothetical protein